MICNICFRNKAGLDGGDGGAKSMTEGSKLPNKGQKSPAHLMYKITLISPYCVFNLLLIGEK